MIEAILLQIPPPVREAVRIRSAYHRNHLVYAKHILLHHLIIPLLDLIQSPYHGIIVALVAECPLHMHQQVLHRDVLALVQRASRFTRVPTETGKDVGMHTSPIILLEKGVYIKAPEHVHHLRPWIGQLKDRHIQSHGCQPFPLSTPSAPTLAACSLTRSGVSVRVWHSPVWGGRGLTPSADCSALGFRWPSAWSRCPGTGSEPCLSPLPHPRGSSVLLRCTSHQLARGVRLPCRSNWTEFSTQLLSLRQSEAATDHCHASIRGRRLMLKWAEHEITPKKPPPHGFRQHLRPPAPNPDGPA